MNRQTYLAKNQEVDQQWWIVDATDQVMGRLAVRLAVILMGKNKPEYTPHHDVGDFVVITNAEKIKLTGSKADLKVYETFSGHPSGRKTRSYRWMIENRPELLLTRAIQRMLPKNKLARAQIKKLKVYRGEEHPHQAQNPQALPM
jgi:large subunit ribosomal protein L13